MTAQQGFAPHITTFGNGPRRAVALHCTMAFGGAWAGLARGLADTLTLVAPDMPSHGHSPDWDEVSNFGDTVAAATAALLGDAPVDIIGHSFGAAIALRLAVEMPGRVRSLSLFEPVLFGAARAASPEIIADHDALNEPFFDAMKAGKTSDGARLFNRMWGNGAPWDSLPARTRAAMIRAIHVVPSTFEFLLDDCCGLLAVGALDSVDVPTLLMRGELSPPIIAATNDALADMMPNARQAVIARAGHMAPISHPADVAAEISTFLPTV